MRDRVRAAGIVSEDVPGGFAVTDPFGMTVHIVVADSSV